MDPTTKAATSELVKSVAQFGNRISSVAHNFVSLEGHAGSTLPSLIGSLDACSHFLNQICGLLSLQEQSTPLLVTEGLRYVEVLAEECSIAIDKIRWTITDENYYENCCSPKYWKSPVSINEKGTKVLIVPNLDEAALFRDMKVAKGRKGRVLCSALAEPAERLDYLQLLLLLVIQVMTVQDMTKKLPSGTVDLASIVDHHARIVRATRKLNIASIHGMARHAKSEPPLSFLHIASDSDSGSGTSSGSDSEITRRGPPPPPPPKWVLPTPVSLPKETTASTQPPCPVDPSIPPLCSSSLPNTPSAPRLVVLEGENGALGQNVDPPSYSEKEGVAKTLTVVSELPEKFNQADEKPSDHKVEGKLPEAKQTEQSPDSIGQNKIIDTHVAKKDPVLSENDNAKLLNSQSSGLGMKLKSFFRSKSSLEAEMKRMLSDANASLKAFIVQHRELRKVPHSAFHSLEYTHMRTILWQLNDNSWFKTFSDLTDGEHDSMESMLKKFWRDGKWFQRELVVLKVMQENKYNAWMRVLEDCIGIEWGKPHHENYRIILAIVREKQCAPDAVAPELHFPFKPRPRIEECYDPPRLPRVPDPLPNMQGDKMLVELDKPTPPPVGPPPASIPSCPPSFGSRGPPPPPPPGWMGPPPPVPNINNASNNNHGALSPSGEIQLGYSEVISHHAVSDESAWEALTSFEAFTFRPATQQQSPIAPLLHVPSRTWSRCFITREREDTRVLLTQIEKFRLRGISIIDLKLQLTEPQAAQVTNLVQELNSLEKDKRFEHKMVELSMVDRENGIITKQTVGTNVDVIHVITRRTLKPGIAPLTTYNALISRRSLALSGPPGLSRGPPPPPPGREPEIIIIDDNPRQRPRQPLGGHFGSSRRRSVASSVTSDSDSSLATITTSSSFAYRRHKSKKSRKYRANSDTDSSSDEEEVKPRWKTDPITIKFSKKEEGKDVVQLLLERWTPAGDGMVEGKDETKEDEGGKKKKRKPKKKLSFDNEY